MTWNLDLLFNVKKINPWPVTLPDGKLTYAKKYGSVKIRKYLILENVYFIPKLAILCLFLNCYNKVHCVIQIYYLFDTRPFLEDADWNG